MGPPDPGVGSGDPAAFGGRRHVAVAAALAVAAVVAAPIPVVATPAVAVAAGGPGVAAASADECDGTAGERALVVENASTGDRLLAAPVENGTPVALAYTHSVERTRVLDGYEVRGDRLVMVRMEFESYGAGLPAAADVNRTDDGSFVFDPDGSFAELHVTPGRVAGHELHVGNRTVDLVARSNASTVRLHVACAPDAGAGDG